MRTARLFSFTNRHASPISSAESVLREAYPLERWNATTLTRSPYSSSLSASAERLTKPSGVRSTSSYVTPNSRRLPMFSPSIPITGRSVSYGVPVAYIRTSPGRSSPNSATVSAWVPDMICGRQNAASAPNTRAVMRSVVSRPKSPYPYPVEGANIASETRYSEKASSTRSVHIRDTLSISANTSPRALSASSAASLISFDIFISFPSCFPF